MTVPPGTQSGTRIALDGTGRAAAALQRARPAGRHPAGPDPDQAGQGAARAARASCPSCARRPRSRVPCRSTTRASSVGCGTRSPASELRSGLPRRADRSAATAGRRRTLLDGTEGRHAAVVRRIRPGETVRAGRRGRPRRHRAGGRRPASRACTVEVAEQLVEGRHRPVRCVVVQALAKGDRGELAVEMLTEVGVTEIVPWQAARSIVRWSGERGVKGLARWRSTAREAAKQSRRLWTPAVAEPVDTAGLAAADRGRGPRVAAARGGDRRRWPT